MGRGPQNAQERSTGQTGVTTDQSHQWGGRSTDRRAGTGPGNRSRSTVSEQRTPALHRSIQKQRADVSASHTNDSHSTARTDGSHLHRRESTVRQPIGPHISRTVGRGQRYRASRAQARSTVERAWLELPSTAGTEDGRKNQSTRPARATPRRGQPWKKSAAHYQPTGEGVGE